MLPAEKNDMPIFSDVDLLSFVSYHLVNSVNDVVSFSGGMAKG